LKKILRKTVWHNSNNKM